MIPQFSIFGKNETIKHRNVQEHVSPYGRIDGTSTGITADDVSQTVSGEKGRITQIYISLSSSADVKVKSLDDRTVTIEFQSGVNPVPLKEVISDPGNPTQIDIYY
jgi:ABC-type oligopeptide transport system substrate-binding subunit